VNDNEVEVTGNAQQRAWAHRVLPPIEEVRPGVWSVPVPIPHNPLRYTLSYAFVDDSGVVLIDPGWDTADGRHALKAGLAAAGADLTDLRGVVATHVHPDHHGLSGWLRDQSGAWIGMHPAEATTLPGRIWRDRGAGEDLRWLSRHGVPDDVVVDLAVDPARIADMLDMAEPDRFIEDGDRLPVPGREVRAVWTPGHTPGHLCLQDAEAGILLTGDHLLPRISPNIGTHDDSDPLTEYLGSLEQTARFGDFEALPAHEYRFRGVDRRAAGLIAHHKERIAEILAAVDRLPAEPAWTIAAELTWSRGWASLRGMMLRMALAETVAHLHHLLATGRVVSTPGPPVVWRGSAPQ
jgi:glyoxylase-like metal-dependent hydrolase (beta-lactamase superfamily II)